jgi:hypothetical protein
VALSTPQTSRHDIHGNAPARETSSTPSQPIQSRYRAGATGDPTGSDSGVVCEIDDASHTTALEAEYASCRQQCRPSSLSLNSPDMAVGCVAIRLAER